MHFPLSTIATTALLLTATEAFPYRNHNGRPHHTGANGAAPSRGFGGDGGRNRTEGGRGRGRFPSGGFFSGLPSGFPSGLPSGLPNVSGAPSGTQVPSGPAPTAPPNLPTGIPDLNSVSFEFPTSIAGVINAVADDSDSSTKTTKTKTKKAKTTTSVAVEPTGSNKEDPTSTTSIPAAVSTGSTAGNSSTVASTILPSSAAASTTFPQAAGESTLSKPMSVTGEFDGGMVRFGRGVTCGGQSEGGDSDAVFQIQEGGTLKNVIIGADQSEGVHCMGACTIENVWWEAVCEDALTIKQESGVSYVIGGGAKGASDKVIQHNGGGTVSVSGFYAEDFGKLYRSCGNCDTMFERHVIMDGIVADGGSSTLVGINSNFGDTATITNSCITNTKTICTEFEGNDTGAEPAKIGSGISAACIYTDADVAAC